MGSFGPIQEIDSLIERERDESSTIFNAAEADIAVLQSKYSVDTQHNFDSGSDSEWENGMKLILNGTHLMLLMMNWICNFVSKLLFL